MTNLEMIVKLRQKGKYYVPVMGKPRKDETPNAYYVAIEKKDMIAHLQGFGRNDKCEWKIGAKYLDGYKLEVTTA